MPPKKHVDVGKNEENTRVSILSLLDDEEADETSISTSKVKRIKILKYVRITILLAIWIAFTTIMLITDERDIDWTGTSVPVSAEGKMYPISLKPEQDNLYLLLRGPFTYKLTDMVGRESVPHFLKDDEVQSFIDITVLYRTTNDKGIVETEEISEKWHVNLIGSKDFEVKKTVVRKHDFKLSKEVKEGEIFYKFVMQNVEEPVPILLQSFPCGIPTTTSLIIAALVVVGLYIMLFWDITSRAIIVLLFCTLSVSFMGLYHLRPALPDIPKFVDINYILLLMGLTIIVGVFAETGGDLYLVVQVFRLSRGHIWPLLTVICIIAAIGSAFLDRLTSIVIITLFVLRYCEIQQLNAGNVLTCIMLFSNIGNMLTPNPFSKTSILNNPEIVQDATTLSGFWQFLLHMLIPVVFTGALTYIFLRIYFHSTKSMKIVEAPIVSRLKHAIRFWNHTAKSLGDYSEMEKAVQQNVLKKVTKLRARLKRLGKMPLPPEDFNVTLQRLKERHTLTNVPQILMCGIILLLVFIVQIAHFFGWHYLAYGWTCLFFSLILLALVNWHDFESLMTKMDWSTILLIACIMITTRALAVLGVLDAMGDSVVKTILSIDKVSRLYWGVVIMIFVSAFGSAFFDTDYVCFSLASKVYDLVNVSDVPLPYEPLILSLFLGAGFGTNMTLISCFSNVVCSGLTEKHDFKFYFWDYFKVGSIVTLFGITVSIVYMLSYVVIFY